MEVEKRKYKRKDYEKKKATHKKVRIPALKRDFLVEQLEHGVELMKAALLVLEPIDRNRLSEIATMMLLYSQDVVRIRKQLDNQGKQTWVRKDQSPVQLLRQIG